MSATYRTIVLTAAGCEATGGHVLGCIACGSLAAKAPDANCEQVSESVCTCDHYYCPTHGWL